MEEAKHKTRRRHDRDLKDRVLSECDVPGASVAQIALNHGLNANLVHKWRRETSPSRAPIAVAGKPAQFVPVALPPGPESLPDLRIELRRGTTTITVAWPMAAAAECASWMRELLR